MRAFTFACLATSLLCAGGAAAQESVPVEKRFGLDLYTGAIESGAAQREGTGERGWGMGFSGAVTGWRIATVSAEMGFMDLGDENAFTEPTTGGVMTSSVSALLVTVATGLRTPPTGFGEGAETFSAGVNVGWTYLHANRGIANCQDCTTQDVELQAGTFVEPGALLTIGSRGWGLTARYRIYGGGADLQNTIAIGVSGAL